MNIIPWQSIRPAALRAGVLALTAGAVTPAYAQTVDGGSVNGCGYTVTTGTTATWPNGYIGWVDITNVSGDAAAQFEVLLDVGHTTVTSVIQAEYEETGQGYLVTEPFNLTRRAITEGSSHRFRFIGQPEYEGATPYLLSINGEPCDIDPPEITLTASDTFFVSPDTLTLTVSVSDDTAVRRVVFEQNGEVIGEDFEAPFELDIEVNETLNGFHLFTATAYDPTGNTASTPPERVFVSIDNKFIGTAPGGTEDYEHLLTYFNQLTPENAGKWGSVESERDVMNWEALDTAYYFAQENALPFKFHTLLWGQQQPEWLVDLAPEEQLAEIEEWMSLVAGRYSDLTMIEVVNEPLHAPPAYIEALGGVGETGWDWVVTGFELAREYFPEAQLILNDYQILHLPEFTDDYLEIINILQERGLIDAIGLQAHFLERADVPVVAANLDTLAATGLPIYISEFDLNLANDAWHANVFQALFTLFWEHPAVAGVTHWGHLEDSVWRPNAFLIRQDDSTRPALDWLVCYLAGGTSCTVPEYIPAGWQGDEYGVTLEAEEYDTGSGVLALGSSVAYTDAGDWISFADVEFQSGWDTFWVTYAKGNTEVGNISIHLDSLESDPVLTVELPPTAGWGTSATLELPWPSLSETRDVYIRFNDVDGVANIDNLRFGKPRPVSAINLITDGGFENSTLVGWQSWNGSTLSLTDELAHTGSQSLLATDRPNTNQFAVYNLTSVVSPGTTYAVSAQALHTGADADTLRLAAKVECANPPEGHNTYPWIDNQGSVPAGQWTQLSGNLVVPDCDIVDVAVFFEGAERAPIGKAESGC